MDSSDIESQIRGSQHIETGEMQEENERGSPPLLAESAKDTLSHNASRESPRGKGYTHRGQRLSTLSEFDSAIGTLGGVEDQSQMLNGAGSFQSEETNSYHRGTSFISSSGTSSNNSSYHQNTRHPRNRHNQFLRSNNNLDKENHPIGSPISTGFKSEDVIPPSNRDIIDTFCTSPNEHSFYSCNHTPPSSAHIPNRARLDSEEAYNALVAAHSQQSQQQQGLKFYDSDADTENESVIYNAQLRVGSYQSHVESAGSSMGGGNANGRVELGVTDNSRFVKSGIIGGNRNKSSKTPHPSNRPHSQRSANHAPNTSDANHKNAANGRYSKRNQISPSNNPHTVLPYHKRRLLAREEASEQEQRGNDDEIDQHHLNYARPQKPSELSTISKPLQSTTSPLKLEQHSHSPTSRQLPPSGAAHQQSYRNYNAQGNYHSVEEDSPPHKIKAAPPPPRHPHTSKNNRLKAPSRQNRQSSKPHSNRSPSPPTRHVRADSSGSISSLGSLTGGASSISRQGGKALVDQLQNDIKTFLGRSPQHKQHQHMYEDQNNIIDNPEEFFRYERIRSRQSHEGSGFLSSILGSMSVSSTGSGYQSLEDDTEDFHEKNQAFLQKAERDRAKQQRSFWGGENSGGNGRDFSFRAMNSQSPKQSSVRSHRPGLASIDNDNWEEEHNHQGRSDKKRSKRRGRGNDHLERRRSPPQKQRNKSNHRVSSRSKNYGSTGQCEHHKGHSTRTQHSGRSVDLNQTIKRSNIRHNKYESSSSTSEGSEEENSESDDSNVSSDFTSNQKGSNDRIYGDESSDGDISYDEDYQEHQSSTSEEYGERTSLLPPSGISTNEGDGSEHRDQNSRPRRERGGKGLKGTGRDCSSRRRERRGKNDKDREWRHRDKVREWEERQRREKRRRRIEHDQYHDYNPQRKYYVDEYSDDSSYDDYRREVMSHKMKERLIDQWRAEFFEEAQRQRAEENYNRLYNRLLRWLKESATKASDKFGIFCSDAERFISNLPLTIGAVALAIVTLGVVWFKFAEEILDSCEPVHYHSRQCNFPEFPGCFYCDTSEQMYKVAVNFHFACTGFAFLVSLLFVAKVCIARAVVIDEMNSPTTSSPVGLFCMTLVCVFAGRGAIGQAVVTLAAIVHFLLAAWFIFMAGAYNILPDPSWYPNTVGIGLTAVKTWLYYPLLGHFLMATSLSLYFLFFPISVVRVFMNNKLSAPVAWIQMSAPAVALYALTIMAQPSFEEEHPDVTEFQRVHRMLYLPSMHVLFVLALIGMISSVQSLYVRWETFSKKEFSPAHAAFCFPTLAYANGIQAYRGAIDAFSDIKPHSTFKIVLDIYWFTILVGGTLATIIITFKFFYMLPSWTSVDVADEIEPPAPHETLMAEVITSGDTLRHNFVSPAVLQANEAGALVRLPGREAGRNKYVRTRRVTALGFEPIMNLIELNNERDALLDWVAKNPPRQRKRTLSVPGITYNLGNFGQNNTGVYSGNVPRTMGSAQRRARAQTSDGYYGISEERYPNV